MTELMDTHEYETKMRHSLGMMLIKPDAIEAGIAEELIVHTFDKLRNKIPDINLKGVVFVESFKHEQTDKIYPGLDEKYKKAYREIYHQGPMVVAIWDSKSELHDIWANLKSIRGKVTLGYGLEDSIRSIIPLPGQRVKYEELTGKLKAGSLSDNDYIELSKNLVHIPENIKEFAGLFINLCEDDVSEIFGKKYSANLRQKMLVCLTHTQ